MLKRFFLILIFFVFSINDLIAKTTVYIVATVDSKIITNYDVEKEADYLKALNPKLSNLGKEKITELSKSSLINEIIKKNEIEKILDLDNESQILDDYLKDFYKKLNFEKLSDFENYLTVSTNYSLNEVKEKLKIEIMWNELIYLKYSKQVSLDKQKIEKKIENLKDSFVKEYQLSEIVFNKKKNIDLDDLVKKINSSIDEIGFNNTANIYSISESAKLGGKIGLISENNLSKAISNKLKNLEEGQKTDPIQIGNNFIILKVEKINQNKILYNKDEELKKMIKFETNKQLNQFSKIFFDKSKINYSINEK